jgi:myo-inositol 2-dehydrogenase / D-chiro-inositol 1-dehydrogenase
MNIGLIGCGIMGADHAEILQRDVAGGRLAGLQDADGARAHALSRRLGGIAVFGSAESLIADPSIDAVVIASPDETHARYVLACIAANKPVLCEKPLAATLPECRAIVDAELEAGRLLVQVGFMRRFDPGYRAMKASLAGGSLGRPTLLHCIHRNKVAPDYITSDLVIANAMVHEMDIARYLLDEDFAAVSVTAARASRHSTRRGPLFVVLETASGVVVSVEMTPDAQYGYDVQAELVCEDGTVSLAPAPPVALRRRGLDGHTVAEDWRPRFADAYRIQLRDWVAAISDGRTPGGSTAWDGFVVAQTAAAALQALASRERTPVRIGARPGLYAG